MSAIRQFLDRGRGLDPRWLLHAARGHPPSSGPEDWDDYYRGVDPYGYETSPYERRRYGLMLAALGERRFSSGLELGCSVGVFTEMLAPRCDRLVALDISAAAVTRARERLAGHPQVRVERATLPEEFSEGSFDLVVCADVAEYWDRPTWRTLLGRIEASLLPGGSLLGSFWRPFTPTHRMSGDGAARLVRRATGLKRVRSLVESKHRIERFDKGSG
ncbi:MAG: nodulation S family protein [Actinomycetota bacterium]|nr:nodulation S family protein [Actinomycetota bacterium]